VTSGYPALRDVAQACRKKHVLAESVQQHRSSPPAPQTQFLERSCKAALRASDHLVLQADVETADKYGLILPLDKSMP